MLLTTKAIEEKALELYQRVLKDYHVSEDMTSDIYYLFIKRMTAYKKNHREINEVSPAFVNGALKFIIRDLRKKEQLQKNKDEELFVVEQGMFSYCEHIDEQEERDWRLEKLYSFMIHFSAMNPIYKEYVQFFLLYYCFYLPVNFIKALCDEIDLDSDFINEQLPKIRNEAIKRSSVKKRDNEKSLSKVLFAIIACHRTLNQMDNAQKKQAELNRLEPLHFEQARHVEEYKGLEVLPFMKKTAELCGVSEARFRYGFNLFVTRFREYVKPALRGVGLTA